MVSERPSGMCDSRRTLGVLIVKIGLPLSATATGDCAKAPVPRIVSMTIAATRTVFCTGASRSIRFHRRGTPASSPPRYWLEGLTESTRCTVLWDPVSIGAPLAAGIAKAWPGPYFIAFQPADLDLARPYD